jgi:hypothetical protein
LSSQQTFSNQFGHVCIWFSKIEKNLSKLTPNLLLGTHITEIVGQNTLQKTIKKLLTLTQRFFNYYKEKLFFLNMIKKKDGGMVQL